MNRFGSLAAALVMCMTASSFAQTVKLSMQVGGKTRTCMVHVPSGATKAPLVFFVHGANGSGAAFESETKGDATADREKFIAAYPSASSDGSTGTWDDMQGVTNFPFFLAVIDTVDARYHIDRNKIYMTGFSQGGMISYVASCSYSDVFAAVAPVSGHSNTTCTLKRPVPVFMTFGTSDIGPTSTFVADANLWNKWNKCPSMPTIVKPYPASSANSGVTRVTYGPCDQGSVVILDSIQGEGHQWPAASRLNQADEVWAFFKQYSLNSTTRLSPQDPARSRASFSVSYAAGIVSLAGVAENSRVQVTDTKGQVLATPVLSQSRFSFKNRPSGVYLVKARGSAGLSVSKFIVP